MSLMLKAGFLKNIFLNKQKRREHKAQDTRENCVSFFIFLRFFGFFSTLYIAIATLE
jgi:hypothetical protein